MPQLRRLRKAELALRIVQPAGLQRDDAQQVPRAGISRLQLQHLFVKGTGRVQPRLVVLRDSLMEQGLYPWVEVLHHGEISIYERDPQKDRADFRQLPVGAVQGVAVPIALCPLTHESAIAALES